VLLSLLKGLKADLWNVHAVYNFNSLLNLTKSIVILNRILYISIACGLVWELQSLIWHYYKVWILKVYALALLHVVTCYEK